MRSRLLICTLCIWATACAQQWRTSDPQVDSADMMQWLSDAQGASSQSSGGAASEISATDPGTEVFFADAPGPMGTVASVLAFDDLSFLSDSAPAISQITEARVFFLDNPNGDSGHQDELIVGVIPPGSTDYQYYKFTGTGSFDSGTFQVDMNDSNGNRLFSLVSYDVDGNSFNGTIQLRVLAPDSDGNDVEIGKFSVLAGFQ